MLEEKNPELTDLNVLSEIDLKKLELKIRPLEMKDFEAAFKKIKSPLTRKEIKKYEE
ncbi:hypothetical protein [Thermococcus radiotolerans]|uniref:hypothetical protein n=1 Tax=Thermococcus radiotolerans TaxID=187880 RepID=UPI0026943903